MERKKAQSVTNVTHHFLREMGLETPLLQHRLLQAWPKIVGETYAQRTKALEIRNQTLLVAADSPSLCAHLSMHRSVLVASLNHEVKGFIISDIKFVPSLETKS